MLKRAIAPCQARSCGTHSIWPSSRVAGGFPVDSWAVLRVHLWRRGPSRRSCTCERAAPRCPIRDLLKFFATPYIGRAPTRGARALCTGAGLVLTAGKRAWPGLRPCRGVVKVVLMAAQHPSSRMITKAFGASGACKAPSRNAIWRIARVLAHVLSLAKVTVEN